jgi:tRNA(Ile)-lysidine synthase
VLAKFKEHIKEHFPNLFQEKFLLACSGGLDSVVLAHLCSRSGLDFTLAHCNFKLRGKESETDEKFVQELAVKLGKSVVTKHFDTLDYARSKKISVQMAARALRYEWFTTLMQENTIETCVTAHHADDNLETFIINLSRGTGIKGLTGIPSRTTHLARPLLPFTRKRILEFAEQNDLAWREDSSNAETKYLRNKIRQEVLPVFKELHPTFMVNFAQTQEYLKQTAALSKNHIDQLKETLFKDHGDIIRISIASLTVLKPLNAYLYGLFRSYGFTEWEDVKQLLSAMSGKEVRSKTHRLLKDRDLLLLSRIVSKSKEQYTIGESTTQIEVPVRLSFELVDGIQETGEEILYIDKETLKYPLSLRKWQKGDYFYPLNMKGRKKLAKYFKDEKVNVIAKEKQWLLCSGDDIVWVIGKRADDRFKITGKTSKVLKIVLNQ